MAVNVLNPGLATSVQDLGRPGYFHLGIPVSGAMDHLSLRCANLLVGNPEDAACLEAVFVGPTLQFEKNCVVAVTGGDMTPLVDGVEQETWAGFDVLAGQTLSFSHLKSGARIYIAISGGIDVPVVLGSRSTYTLGALGGFQGRLLEKDDCLPVGDSVSFSKTAGAQLPENLRRHFPSEQTLRVLPGLYWHRITEASGEQFFKDSWTVAPEADRIGYRFKGGTALEFVEREQPFGAGSDPSNIVDGCYPYGSIQVPGGTEPIILHRDAVSGGGYFMVGTVISSDLDLIGQMQPNTKARFESVTMEQALSARRDYQLNLQKIREILI
ncbi:biotin-dependent carboxyltransferase family protein [Enterovibrio norvegicus]|uniref:5-oxoprolinase subunit C family protein n=1 Tax=Enterovibrio norvegicus TaxID=188144 RepID=UPI000C850329|nr:biotin-dependent carboxyltransferase family protein [Enterovibrio norvegicus]PML81928.1 allophanate hydrolase [Enterovibrio norvegicus]